MPFLDGAHIEILRPDASAAGARFVLFDFDGTLSLIRSGWERVMVPMFVEILADLKSGESHEELTEAVREWVYRLTGKQTIYQMIELAEQVRRRGGGPREPLEYKRIYHERLWKHIRERVEGLRGGTTAPQQLTVPGARRLLEALRQRGLRLYLASGTDETYTADEARLLGLADFFGGGIRGAIDEYQRFSKRILIQRLIAEENMKPGELLAFGDGYVEIENAHEAGGVTVGVATDEPECRRVNEWKRERLVRAGADFIVPNFLEADRLLECLFGGSPKSPPRRVQGPRSEAAQGTLDLGLGTLDSSRYPRFDRSRLRLRPLSERVHDLDLANWLPLDGPAPPFTHPDLPALAQRMAAARTADRPVILMMGAHLVRAGVSRHLIDLMERGQITHVAMNGAGAIHEYELARIGATTESVARYIASGEFGLWSETGLLNDWTAEAARADAGMGETIGRKLLESGFPHSGLTLLAAGCRLGIPVTIHVGVGYDIIHEHPNCDGAALGAASYTDFLILARAVEALEGGVLLNFGSAVMGPEVYLKALAMARNVARQEGREIRRFTTAVFDLREIPGDFHRAAAKTDPSYYFRPYKTILVRTVADGGQSFYFCGDHHATIPALRAAILAAGTSPQTHD
jgi:phosphoglycolate phosphatase-like HAD superfamily hydrolase